MTLGKIITAFLTSTIIMAIIWLTEEPETRQRSYQSILLFLIFVNVCPDFFSKDEK